MKHKLSKEKIHKALMESIKKVINGKIISEGVTYDEQSNSFTFDFEHDNENDMIKLENVGFSIKQFERCFYYGYEFSKDVNSKARAEFIKQIKFPTNFENSKDLKLFISKAIEYLDSQITLPQFNVIVYPQSISELNREMLAYISRITTVKYVQLELIKELPSNIEFDYDRFTVEVLNSTINGRPRYTQTQKEDVLKNISEMMDNIHQNDYFSIARNVKKNKYRQYIKNYYNFKDEDSKKLFETLENNNILLIDDVVTSGTTIYHMLNTLRNINDKNNIVVFSLLGKNFQD